MAAICIDGEQKTSDLISTTLVDGGSHSYQPVVWHWFYVKDVDKKGSWKPFSMFDSVALEDMYQLLQDGKIPPEEAIVSTDGGRYDADIPNRTRTSVYWTETVSLIRRCSWFSKSPMDYYVPYEEEMAEKLEEEYRKSVITNRWHRVLEFPHGEKITFKTANTMLQGCVDDWNQVTDLQMQPMIVKRGIEGFEIADGESQMIDHLVFLVHGIGSVCDLRFRPIVDVVDDFRTLSDQLLRSHFKSALHSNEIGRVEFIPVSWHDPLHGEDTGIDKRLQPITLTSIPKLRHFANDTILDILFYTSPVYCQKIISTVGGELNRLYNIFIERNRSFVGQVSVGGHSLGSLILFDILSHQPNVDSDMRGEDDLGMDLTLEQVCEVLDLGNYLPLFIRENITLNDLRLCAEEDLAKLGLPMGPRKRLLNHLREMEIKHKSTQNLSDKPHFSSVSYAVGLAGAGQPIVSYPKLDFHPFAFYALGSPVGMFVTVRGIDKLGKEFLFPTCPRFFNIFHPYDPVAYRIETLIDSAMVDVTPVLIPHHKGRKRYHIELKEKLIRYSADFERFLGSVRSTWNSFSMFRSAQAVESISQDTNPNECSDSSQGDNRRLEQEIRIGKLNGGNRIDYVLQETPLESFNEYLFAFTSHVVYWESEDTMLFMLKETYAPMGKYPDN